MKTLFIHSTKLLSFFLAITFITACSSCNKECFTVNGKGPLVNKSYSLSTFNSIHTSVSAHVFLTQGTSYSVEIKGQQNILDILDVESKNNVLSIGFNNHCGSLNYDELQVYITMPDVKSIAISGSGSVEATNTLNVSNINFDISGSANISATLNVQNAIEGNISGSGELYLAGTTPYEKFTISGSGGVFAFGLAAQQANINISGSGDAELSVSNQLDVTISGSGDVKYKGQPSVNSSISGSGKLNHVN